jgi:predicted 3-demethylubiquinone-9 3-methyltransferase (glyoxalase superfamily)
MKKITPFLWFDTQAEEAARFYVSIFERSRITSVSRAPGASPGRPGRVMSVAFRLAGQDFLALNGGPHFTFTPAISLFVDCKTQPEIDRLWRRLTRGGQAGRCGWLTDRYGLSWQIVPSGLGGWIKHPAAMQAMLAMGKLDARRLEAAAATGGSARGAPSRPRRRR